MSTTTPTFTRPPSRLSPLPKSPEAVTRPATTGSYETTPWPERKWPPSWRGSSVFRLPPAITSGTMTIRCSRPTSRQSPRRGSPSDNAPAPTEYCPEDSVTREQMAAFLHRALPDLDVIHPEAGSFADVWGPVIDTGQPPVFYEDMAWLARTGVTVGCNPPTNTLFCPSDLVLRGQMASFLARASDLPQTEPLAPTLTEVLSITDGSRRPMGAPPDPLHRHVPWRGLGRLGHSSHR